MKKIMAMLLAVMMVLGLFAACGGNDTPDTTVGGGETPDTTVGGNDTPTPRVAKRLPMFRLLTSPAQPSAS